MSEAQRLKRWEYENRKLKETVADLIHWYGKALSHAEHCRRLHPRGTRLNSIPVVVRGRNHTLLTMQSTCDTQGKCGESSVDRCGCLIKLHYGRIAVKLHLISGVGA